MTYSRMGNATLPSAMQRFTSEFGMGSGGSAALLSSGKEVDLLPSSSRKERVVYSRKPITSSSVASVRCCLQQRLGVIWSSLTGN